MSGFIAIFNLDGKPINRRLLQTLTHTLKFRGPDREDIWISKHVGMGHTLFRTTNEAQYEQQPATLDGKAWITSSARIDNRINLVNKLGMTNEINLDQTPDSELILHAYRKWGEKCLEHLLGDFAFVIWDSQEKKIFCAKDRFGMRQLHYANINNNFIVCNSLDTLRQHPNISEELNDKAIAGFLLFGDHAWLDKSFTMFKDINSLLPAHKLIMQNGKISITKYWDIPSNLPLLNYKNKSDYIEHFREIFKTSVEDRLRTPSIVISMSGGMDSSSIAATVRELEKDKRIKSTKVQAVTSVYDRLFSSQERYYAGIVSEHLNIPIHYVPADDYPFIESKTLTTRPLEEYTATYWRDFKKNVASYSRVVLTGKSADNLLYFSPAIHSLKESNYLDLLSNIYQLRKQYGKMPPLGTGIRSFLKKGFKRKTATDPYPFPKWFNPEFEKNMNLKYLWKAVLQQNHLPQHPRHPKAYHLLTAPDWNQDDFYMDSNFTFAEERDPFLDLRLIEFLFALPSIPWFFNKHILRESMRGILPNEIIERPKTVLGNMHAELLQESSSKWLADWQEVPGLSNYISSDKVASFALSDIDEETLYVNLRVIILNSWISTLRTK